MDNNTIQTTQFGCQWRGGVELCILIQNISISYSYHTCPHHPPINKQHIWYKRGNITIWVNEKFDINMKCIHSHWQHTLIKYTSLLYLHWHINKSTFSHCSLLVSVFYDRVIKFSSQCRILAMSNLHEWHCWQSLQHVANDDEEEASTREHWWFSNQVLRIQNDFHDISPLHLSHNKCKPNNHMMEHPSEANRNISRNDEFAWEQIWDWKLSLVKMIRN